MADPSTVELTQQIEQMRPWHHDIVLTNELSTGKVFSPSGTLPKDQNEGISLISPQKRFSSRIGRLFPNGMSNARFLDCACNAGAYCFYARELGAECVGFDVREHWIQQARFVQKHRRVGPTDNIEFHVMDLADLGNKDWGEFDATFFSGIFYHLPDPIAGLKLAADRTKEIFLVNTACMSVPLDPFGLTMAKESRTERMSGAHQLAWFPNSVQTMVEILVWLGFKEMKLTLDNISPTGRRRIEIVSARTPGRLMNLKGEVLKSQYFHETSEEVLCSPNFREGHTGFFENLGRKLDGLFKTKGKARV